MESLYPWSTLSLLVVSEGMSPLGRTGQATSMMTKEGTFYMFGGLSNHDQTVKSDIWAFELQENGRMKASPVKYRNQGPSARVGHASLLVGNAFIGEYFGKLSCYRL